VFGTTPWIYPDSPFQYTSLEGLPLWGFGGLIIVMLYQSITEKTVEYIDGIMLCLLLAVLWVAGCSILL